MLFSHPIHSPKFFFKDEKAHYRHAARWPPTDSSKFPYLPRGGGIALPIKKTALVGKAVVLLLLLLGSFSKVEAQSTIPFIQVLDPSSVALNSSESAKLAQIQGNTLTQAYWHINVNSLESNLSGTSLTTTLPGVTGSKTFTADYVFSRPNGEYYWSGTNSSGDQIRVGKASTGYYGNIGLPNLDIHYGIQKLSDTRYVLVKYDGSIIANPGECATAPSPDEEEDSVVEDRGSCDGNVIRVLFLFTSGAVASGFDPYVVAPAVIAELNATTGSSGLSNSDISFALANVGQLYGFIESTVGGLPGIIADRESLITNTSAQNAREYSKADIVILLTAPAYGLTVGIAGGISAKKERAYGIAVIGFASASFTATHEIGHIIGARHQRCFFCGISPATTGCDVETNYHGFPIGTTGFRTIMMQQTCAGARTGRWSNPNSMLMGFATGDNDNNNASILKSRADNVACFLGDPTLPIYPYFDNWVYLSGPYSVCDGDDDLPYSVSYSSLWFTSPVTYSWGVSENGVAPWTSLPCNSNQCTITGINNLPSTFFVRATVTDVNGRSGTEIFKVKKVLCRNSNGSGRDEADTGLIAHQSTVQPNPFDEILTVNNVEKGSWLSVSDLNGRVIQRRFCAEEDSEIHWNLSGLASGFYFLSIESSHSAQNLKICKQ